MGYYILNGTNGLNLNIDAFPRILKLALCFDWIPRGTKAPYDELEKSWDGNYLEMLGQYVTPEDSDDLAKTFENAIIKIPKPEEIKESPQCKKTLSSLQVDLERGLYIPIGKERSELIYTFFDYVTKKTLKEFINFCKTGEGFVIL